VSPEAGARGVWCIDLAAFPARRPFGMVGLTSTMSSDDHRDCKTRYDELLERLHAMSRRIDEIEQDQRMIVDLLGDFRDLIRLVVTRMRTLDRRIADVARWPSFLQRLDERVARHFRN